MEKDKEVEVEEEKVLMLLFTNSITEVIELGFYCQEVQPLSLEGE